MGSKKFSGIGKVDGKFGALDLLLEGIEEQEKRRV